MKLPLEKALAIAGKITAILRPFCDRIEVAGSVRRRRPECGDIDFVLLPQKDCLPALRERIIQGKEILTDGRENLIVKNASGIQFDFFIARPPGRDLFDPVPGNFGSLLLLRTGSKEHNIWLIEEAKKLGMVWTPNKGLYRDGIWLAGEEEQDILRTLGLPLIPPAERER